MIRIGVDIGGTKIEVAALDAEDRELVRIRTPTPREDYEALVAEVVRVTNEVTQRVGGEVSIGVCLPGSVSPATGLIRNANSTVLNGRPFSHDLARALGRPARFENDANCFALSEATDGAARNARLVFGAILGTGVGGGIVLNSQLWLGRNGIAGEWGHNPLPTRGGDSGLRGHRCYCGRMDCIETYLSGPAIELEYASGTGTRKSAREIALLAGQGESHAIETLNKFYERLTVALATVVNLVDPDVIVLGGGLSNIAEIYKRVPSELGTRVFSDSFDTPLVQGRHGDSSGVRGAARLWPKI